MESGSDKTLFAFNSKGNKLPSLVEKITFAIIFQFQTFSNCHLFSKLMYAKS